MAVSPASPLTPNSLYSGQPPTGPISPQRKTRGMKFCICKATFDELKEYGDMACELCQQVSKLNTLND